MEKIARNVFHCQDVNMEDATSPLNVSVIRDGMDCFAMNVSSYNVKLSKTLIRNHFSHLPFGMPSSTRLL